MVNIFSLRISGSEKMNTIDEYDSYYLNPFQEFFRVSIYRYTSNGCNFIKEVGFRIKRKFKHFNIGNLWFFYSGGINYLKLLIKSIEELLVNV